MAISLVGYHGLVRPDVLADLLDDDPASTRLGGALSGAAGTAGADAHPIRGEGVCMSERVLPLAAGPDCGTYPGKEPC
jgi:hypothetical protein